VRAEKLVWDRESAIGAGGRPTRPFLAFCGQLQVGWIILDGGDAQAKGQLERQHRFLESNFEPHRFFANHLDFQDQLDRWAEKANGRAHRTIRGVPAGRLAKERALRPLERVRIDTDRRWVRRVPQQPLVRVDRNDYSLDPRRIFAGSQTIVDPAHESELQGQRERRCQRHEVDVEQRPLSVYDALIA
jgi:hypothetical protein